ncbi:hypothetical protein Tco_1221758 [Tanacetum coccineum]
MAALESCPKHNMIAYLEKTEGNVEFHEVIDFLQRSYISHALTVSPVVSTTFVEQFWTSAKSKTINNVRHITAKVAGKLVSISEASIRTDLLFDDADGIDTLPNQAIFDAIQLMGYEGDLTEEGASSERLSEAQPSPSPAPTSEAPNESLPDSSSAQSSEVPFEQQPDLSPSPSPRPSPQPSPTPIVPDSIPEHTDQAKEIKLLKAKITKLKKKANPIIKHFKAYQKRISKEQRQQRKSVSKKKKVQKESVSKQGRKNAKGDGKAKENAQSEGRSKEMMDEDKETDEVRLSTDFEEVSTDIPKLSTDFEEVSTDRPKLSTDDLKVSTDEQMESSNDQVDASEEIFEGTEEQGEGTEEKVKSTAEQKESTEDQEKEEIDVQASQTPTSMIFGDDETIATLLINMSKAKNASKEKEKASSLESDEELARKVQEEWEAEEERNKTAEEQATNEALIQDFDDIKARIEADRILAEKLQDFIKSRKRASLQ